MADRHIWQETMRSQRFAGVTYRIYLNTDFEFFEVIITAGDDAEPMVDGFDSLHDARAAVRKFDASTPVIFGQMPDFKGSES